MAKGKRKAEPGDVATNRQARHRYHLLENWEAGVMLTGTEVKSLRDGKAQIKDGYAAVRDGEVWLHNVHIPPYGPAARENHEPVALEVEIGMRQLVADGLERPVGLTGVGDVPRNANREDALGVVERGRAG